MTVEHKKIGCWDHTKEKLLCLMVLEDDFAKKICDKAGSAFWRGFIVEDRKSHAITAKMRFKYENGECSWYALSPTKDFDRERSVQELHYALKDLLSQSALRIAKEYNLPITLEDIVASFESFYLPRNEGDPENTIAWLNERAFDRS